MRRVILLTIFLFCLQSSSSADVILFNNGDRLTGELISIIDNNLSFKSNMAGEMTVSLLEIKHFWTDQPMEIHLKDGTVLKSRIFQGKPGCFSIKSADELQAAAPQSIKLDLLAAINPPHEPKIKWKGNITAGFTGTHGNTFNENGSISFNTTRRSKKDRIELSGTYLSGRTKDSDTKEKKTTEESFTIGGKYDYFLTKKLYSYLSSNFKKDHVADLDRRIIIGMGTGYQLIEMDAIKFSTDIGLAHLSEKYTTKNPDTHEKEVEKTDEMSLQFGYYLDCELSDHIIFIHDLNYLPSIEGSFSDYFLRTGGELRLKMTKSMFGSFKAVLDYDSTPAKEVGSTDTKFIFGLGWNY